MNINIIEQIISQSPWILVLSIATIPIKGIALWKSARLSHKWWFIILLITSTFGLLDLIYILLVARKYSVESKDIA